MADSVELAKDRVTALQTEVHHFQAEINRLKDYIRLSEKLLQEGWLGPVRKAEQSGTAEKSGQLPALRAALDANGDDTSDDSEDEMPLELKRDETDIAVLEKAAISEPKRKSLFNRATA